MTRRKTSRAVYEWTKGCSESTRVALSPHEVRALEVIVDKVINEELQEVEELEEEALKNLEEEK